MKSKITLIVAALALVTSTTVLAPNPASAAITDPVFATYESYGSGTIGDIIAGEDVIFVTISGTDAINSKDLSGPDFVPGGGFNEQVLNEPTGLPVPYILYNFMPSVTEVAVYLKLRPTQAGGPTDITISTSSGSVACEINSGLAGATLVGSTLTPDPVLYQEGVLLCTGSFGNIKFEKNGSLRAFDFITMAVDRSQVTPSTTTTTIDTTTTTSGADPVAPAYTG